jgi:hypothetical protein
MGRRRRTGMNTVPTSSSAAAPPTAIRVRYCPSGAKSSDTVPPAPSGTSQACCQPSTRTRCSSRPPIEATQPSLAFSGTDSTDSGPPVTRISRFETSQRVTVCPRTSGAGVSDVDSRRRSCTTKASDGSVASSWSPCLRSTPPSRSSQVVKSSGRCAR